MTALLETSRLGKRYRSTWALRDCDLALPQGRVIALVGPNGAGKTTFLRLATGLVSATEGRITVFGHPVGGAGQVVGFVAQDFPLYKRFRVRELLHMGRSLNPHWDQALAEQRLADLDIPLERRVDSLSGGQRAQVALTLALAKRPRLLILDEPLSNLDPLARREFMQTLMAATVDEDLTVVLSSHNIAELERVCDYLVVLAGGHVQVSGAIEDLLAEHRLLTGRGIFDHNRPGVIQVTSSERIVRAVVRIGDSTVFPGWQSAPIDLEELVLAYLQRSRPHTHSISPEEVPT